MKWFECNNIKTVTARLQQRGIKSSATSTGRHSTALAAASPQLLEWPSVARNKSSLLAPYVFSLISGHSGIDRLRRPFLQVQGTPPRMDFFNADHVRLLKSLLQNIMHFLELDQR